MNILALLGSSRKDGNTAYLAEKVLEGIEHEKIFLSDKQMKPIIDLRHSDTGFSFVDDDYEDLFLKFLKHDIVVFVTPLYWFGMSGPMKIFIDRWSQYLRDERFDVMQEMSKKKAYVIVVGSSPGPQIEALPLIQQFSHIFNFVGMEFIDYLIGKGNRPGEIMDDSLALAKAQTWNTQLKTISISPIIS